MVYASHSSRHEKACDISHGIIPLPSHEKSRVPSSSMRLRSSRILRTLKEKASRQNIWVVLMALVFGRQRMVVDLIRMILDYILTMLEHHTHGLASCQ